MFIDTVKRINIDEFKKEDREVAEKIGNVYNYFAEQVTNAINGNLDYDNINKQVITLTLQVGSDGKPSQTTQFSTNTGVIGTTVLRAVNNTNTAGYVTGQPFISYTASGDGLYTINHITGLTVGNEYTLTIELTF